MSASPPPKVVAVTGASSGIGLWTAVEFAERGHRVVATMRDTGRADELSRASAARDVSVDIVALDVDDQSSVDAAIDTVMGGYGHIDVLVNNAGVAELGRCDAGADHRLRAMVETNLLGAVRCTAAVLPAMRRRGSGMIVNVSSVAGRSGAPFLAGYTASKFGLEGWTECLRYELTGSGISVRLVEPGTYATAMYRRHDGDGGDLGLARVEAVLFSHAQQKGGDPREVARAVANVALRRSRFRTVVGRDARLELLARRLLPDPISHALFRRFLWGRALRLAGDGTEPPSSVAGGR